MTSVFSTNASRTPSRVTILTGQGTYTDPDASPQGAASFVGAEPDAARVVRGAVDPRAADAVGLVRDAH